MDPEELMKRPQGPEEPRLAELLREGRAVARVINFALAHHISAFHDEAALEKLVARIIEKRERERGNREPSAGTPEGRILHGN